MYRSNPFGNPDGARADINEIDNSFFFNDFYAPETAIYFEDLLKKRFIIGTKGSGKTFYLRKIHALLRGRNTGVYVADEMEFTLSCTDKVVRFCNLTGRGIVTEQWKKLWVYSIYAHLITLYLFDVKLKEYVKDEQRVKLEKYLKALDIPVEDVIGVYQVLQYFLTQMDTANKINRFLDHIRWVNIASTLKEIAKYSPEVYVLLDSVDEEYEHAPAFWLQCQKGLFYAGMQLLESGVLGEKLHVITSMRTNVFASVIRSEHSTKYVKESHILYLNWNYSNICYFLREKIKNLDDCFFMDEKARNGRDEKDIVTWLGRAKIYNRVREIEEDIKSYIIRHTRLTPRDIVIICNHLAELRKNYASNQELDVEDFIRHIVHEDAKLFGDELITVCTKQLNSSFMTADAGRYDATEGFIANDIFRENSRRTIKELLLTLKSDRLDYEDMKELDRKVDAGFQHECHFSDILWQNEALGYVDEHTNKVIYFTRHLEVEPVLPKGKRAYVLKTCLIDALDIVNVGKKPDL